MAKAKAKPVMGSIKLQVKAGEANPSPPVGPALGQHGLNIMDFCKEFNSRTGQVEKGTPLPVIITVYQDRSFSFVVKQPPAAVLLFKAIGIPGGSGEPNKKKVGTISQAKLREVAQAKMVDLNAGSIEAAMRILAGTARSAGLIVED